MTRLRSRLFWMVRGAAGAGDAIDSQGAAIRALEEKVARIDTELQALRASSDLRADEVDSMRTQLRGAVDDLGDRIGKVADRLA
jgi:hypothetical protein